MTGHQPAGLPHSEIHGSKVACTSPWLIAACHVLHRLPEPRHPPYALICFRLPRKKNAGAYTLEFDLLLCERQLLPRLSELRNSSLLFLLFHNVNDRSGSIHNPQSIIPDYPLRITSAQCVENNGFEPLTPCVQSKCSSQLS